LPGTNLCMPTVVLSPSEPFCQAASGRG
jgi:hypothetical protein